MGKEASQNPSFLCLEVKDELQESESPQAVLRALYGNTDKAEAVEYSNLIGMSKPPILDSLQ